MKTVISTPFAAAGTMFAAAAFALVAVAPVQAVAGTNFQITSLTTDNDISIDSSAAAGDDRGLIALTDTRVVWGGDDAIVSYLKDDLSGEIAHVEPDSENQTLLDGFVTDLSTETAYAFQTMVDGVEIVTGLVLLNADGSESDTVIDLSQDIALVDYPQAASGWGVVAIWDDIAGVLNVIDPATGVVTVIEGTTTAADMGDVATLDGWQEMSIDLDTLGVLEYVDGEYRIVLPVTDGSQSDVLSISRIFLTTDDAPEVVLDFEGSNPDVYAFVVSPSANRWYTHSEGGWSELAPSSSGMDEPVISFDATTSADVAEEEEALAETGIEAGALAGAALLSVLAGVVVAARRRARD